MRKVSCQQLVILIFCLCLTGLILVARPESKVQEKRVDLKTELLKLNDKYSVVVNDLSPKVIEALGLDDYVFQTYKRRGDLPVTLYVGFYLSGKMIGAAHDPQVCYPAQGWVLSEKKNNKYELDTGEVLNYSSVSAEFETKKELVFYWFQVDSQTASNTFMQKILLLKNKIVKKGESNAFVRISVPVEEGLTDIAHEDLFEFMSDFYPVLMTYIDR